MIGFEQIQQFVCIAEGQLISSLQKRTRKREIVFTRQCIMFFVKKYTKETLEQIGDHYGQGHCGALHAIKTINNLIDTDKIVSAKITSYNYKFVSLIDFEKNIVTDKIEEIKELFKAQIDSGVPISLESILVYNKLLEKQVESQPNLK
jgi:hypothetical protein